VRRVYADTRFLTDVSMLKVQHSIISPDAILDLVTTHYPATNAQKCQLLALGCHDVYLVQGKHRNYALRLYRYQWWPPQEVDEELRFLQVLTRRKLRVCKPLPASSGQRYVNAECAEGIRHAAVFDFIPGRPLGHNFGPRNRNMTQLGELLTRIHHSADTISPAIQRWTMDFAAVYTPLFANLGEVLGHRPKDIDFLKTTAQQVKEKIQSQSRLDFGLCHGDLHLHNVMLSNDNTLTVFDFDWCAYTWRLYDLATIYWSLPRNEKAKAPWAAVLRGYSQARKLSANDKKLLPWFVVYRQFEFLNFQLSMRQSIGRAWLNDNYYDHHIGLLKQWLAELHH